MYTEPQGTIDRITELVKSQPRWGCLDCGLRPRRPFRICRRCGGRMGYSTTDRLDELEEKYSKAGQESFI